MMRKIFFPILFGFLLISTKLFAKEDIEFFIGADYGRMAHIKNSAKFKGGQNIYNFDDPLYGHLFLGSFGVEMGIGNTEILRKIFRSRVFIEGGYGKFGTNQGYELAGGLPNVKIKSLENYYVGGGADMMLNIIPFSYFSLGVFFGMGYDFVISDLSTKGSFLGSKASDYSGAQIYLSGFDGRFFHNEIYGRLGASIRFLKTQRIEFIVRIPAIENQGFAKIHRTLNKSNGEVYAKEKLLITTPTWLISYKIIF
ncbi:outer membrane protein [Helicobacter mustelae]|nr:outer membrane protein [Helicobacter mustelae]